MYANISTCTIQELNSLQNDGQTLLGNMTIMGLKPLPYMPYKKQSKLCELLMIMESANVYNDNTENGKKI
jgi:hypothetical protein